MTRACVLPDCQRSPAKKAICCGQKLCEAHALKHPCPRAAELLAADPKRWRAENAPETALTTQVRDAVNTIRGVTCWRTKRQPKGRQRDDSSGVPDLSGFAAPEGIALFIETKRDHKDDCACDSCADQRDFAARARAANCIVLLGIRTVRQAVDGLRMELARRRGGSIPAACPPPPTGSCA